MSTPLDATLKHLVETDPLAWLRFLGANVPESAVEVIDADVSTLTAFADKVIRASLPTPFLTLIEFQAEADKTLPERATLYKVVLRYRHGIPVVCVIFLLRKRADGDWMNGLVQERDPLLPERISLVSAYRIVRVWEEAPEVFLHGGLGLLPLAPLAKIQRAELPRIIHQMHTRLQAEASEAERADIWTASYVLLGLIKKPDLVAQLLKGI